MGTMLVASIIFALFGILFSFIAFKERAHQSAAAFIVLTVYIISGAWILYVIVHFVSKFW